MCVVLVEQVTTTVFLSHGEAVKDGTMEVNKQAGLKGAECVVGVMENTLAHVPHMVGAARKVAHK